MLVDPQLSDDEHQLDIRLWVTFALLCMCSLHQEIHTKTLTQVCLETENGKEIVIFILPLDSHLLPNRTVLRFFVCLFLVFCCYLNFWIVFTVFIKPENSDGPSCRLT